MHAQWFHNNEVQAVIEYCPGNGSYAIAGVAQLYLQGYC